MKRLWQTRWCLALLIAGVACGPPLRAQESTLNNPATGSTSVSNHHPVSANAKSPVDLFRQLLAMTSEERSDFLTNRPPELRDRILAKVGEYEALEPNEREIRLRATELRWYLMPLLRIAPTNRTARLALIPPDVREIVEARLEQWSILPPTLQREFLDNESLLHYFARLDTGSNPVDNFGREPSEAEKAHWNGLPEPERRQVMAGFNQFFSLTDEEKQRTLNTLSETERRQMEKTLNSFDQMPPLLRAECVHAYAKFASMTGAEQAEFLKNAERWSAMSPAERQAWRDLVVNVPQWPPLPIGALPPSVPGVQPGMATNKN
jgi:hypothetical protein